MIDKKDLYTKLIDSINEFNTGGVEGADVPQDRVTDCIQVQMMAFAQVIATHMYLQGFTKDELTARVLLLMPMIDRMVETAFDDVVARDAKELFPNVGKVRNE